MNVKREDEEKEFKPDPNPEFIIGLSEYELKKPYLPEEKFVTNQQIDNKQLQKNPPMVRQFNTGATRDTNQNKLQYEGFLSPLVLRRFAEFMHKHRHQSDGTLRDPDNWQKGIPLNVYIDSAWRHFIDWWGEHRSWWKSTEGLEEVLCALIFNCSGYLHELLKNRKAYDE